MKKENKRLAREVMSGHCQQLLQRALNESLINRTTADLSDDILAAMNERIAKQDWGAICRLTWLVQCYPDRKFTPILCELLDKHNHDVYMEAIADAFADIEDECSVPFIIAALDIYIVGDDDRHFSRKLIYALGEIGTPEAIDGIRFALQNSNELVRQEAKTTLEFLERKELSK